MTGLRNDQSVALSRDEGRKKQSGMNISPSTWSGTTTILVMASLTILVFFTSLLILLIVWWFMKSYVFPVSYWNMVQAISAAFGTAALISGGYIAYRQLLDASESRYIDVANELFVELNSPENVKARGWIFHNLKFSGNEQEEIRLLETLAQKIYAGEELGDTAEILKITLDKLEEEDGQGQAFVKMTLNSLDRVAFLTQPGWIPEERIMPWMNPMIVKAWLRLIVFVEHERQKRGEDDYYEDAGRLGKKCVTWRIEKYGTAVSRRSDKPV